MKKVLGWHFCDGMKLRDGQPLVAGKVYRHDGQVVPCEQGLHASVRLIDALHFAPGSQLSRVEMRGEVVPHGSPVDKIVGRERKVLWTLDATRTLWLFACWVAEDALKAERKAGREPRPASWSAPKARREWLAGKITDAQLSAAGSAAYRAAGSAADRTADRTAYRAAYSAADSAAYGDAYRAAYRAAGSAAYRTAYSAADRAARERQNRKLTTMVIHAHARAK
jgi:hypothetical protein